MLSRVANSLYWMARYIERAENLARLVDVNQQLLLDFESLDAERLRDYWRPVLLSSGDESLFAKLYQEENSATVMEFLTTNKLNPNSILSCVSSARENARMVRDQLAEEIWEELNGLYLFVNSSEGRELFASDPYRYYQTIRKSSLSFQGIAEATLPRTQVWDFMEVGKFLERADKTTRIIDIKTFLSEEETVSDPPRGFHWLQWAAILRSCSAYSTYRYLHGLEVLPDKALEILLFSSTFPRSVRYSLAQVDRRLHSISGTAPGTFCNEAEKACGQLLARVNFGTVAEVLEKGLHTSLDDLQDGFNLIGDAVFQSYVLMPDKILTPPRKSMSLETAYQMVQAQQQ
ncbi:MAG: alpha-E domain-containing protein [Verrucomicrobiota bacterium]